MHSPPLPARRLYRHILRLHRYMPPALRALGDDYVKAEFGRHKTAEKQYLPAFFAEWQRYATVLSEQLIQKHEAKSPEATLGEKLDVERLEKFNGEQIGQLYALREEAKQLRGPVDISDSENNAGESKGKK